MPKLAISGDAFLRSVEGILWQGEDLYGLLWVALGPGSGPTVRITPQDASFDLLPDGLRFELALVDPTMPRTPDGTPLETGSWKLLFERMRKNVDQLP